MSGGQPGSKLIVYERYPAPVFTSLHWRAEGATQKCCSIKRNKQVVAAKTQAPARALFGPSQPVGDLSSIVRQQRVAIVLATPMISALFARKANDVTNVYNLLRTYM